MNSHCFGEGTLVIDTSVERSVQSCGSFSASVVLPANRIQYKLWSYRINDRGPTQVLLTSPGHYWLESTLLTWWYWNVTPPLTFLPPLCLAPSTKAQIKRYFEFSVISIQNQCETMDVDELPKIFWTSQKNVFLGKHRRSRFWRIFDNLMTNHSFVHRDLLKWNGCYKSIRYISYKFYLVKHWPISDKFYFLCHCNGSEQRYFCCLDCLLCFPLFTALLNQITGEGILTVPQIVEKFHFSVLENHQEEKGNFSPEACEA